MVTAIPPNSPFVNLEEKTFDHEESLPSLPVPPLEQTLDKYLQSVRPHVTDREYLETEALVREFASGVGKHLHRKLQEKASNSRNWLEKWWEEHAYLKWREPSAVLVNLAGPGSYFFHAWPPKTGSQIERAAMHIWVTLHYWQLLRKQQLRRDKDSQGNSLSMYQYKRIFSSCRIPGEHCDQLNYYFKTEEEGPTPRHMVVLCKGRIFSFDVMDSNFQLYTCHEIHQQLQHIMDLCSQQPRGPGLGALTSGQRDTWWKQRNHLVSLHPDNKDHLTTIETSICAVALTEANPETYTEVARDALMGDCENRWFDKSLVCIISQNGTIGCNCDHAPMDAMVLVSMSYFGDLSVTACKGKYTGSMEVRAMPKPTQLHFVLDDVIYRGIEDSIIKFRKRVDNVDVLVPIHYDYGKKFIRNHKLHPDTFVQLCLQLAYYRIYKKPAPTYETATTRKYYHARTETMRSCTMEALEFSKAMVDSSMSNAKCLELFTVAHDKHNKLMREAQDNHGCDRLLFGLYLQAEDEGLPLPAIFHDKSWIKSGGGGNYVLSTSFVGYTPVHGGVAPMCKDGYGIFYCMEADKIIFFVSCWREDEGTSSQKIWSSVSKSLTDMKRLLDGTAKAQTAKAQTAKAQTAPAKL